MRWLLLVMLVGCGGGGPEAPETSGQACGDVGSVYCARALECDLVDDQLTCENEFHALCCRNDGTCNAPVNQTTNKEWRACLDAIEELPCPNVEEGQLPTECLTL